eukprot:g37964.t1
MFIFSLAYSPARYCDLFPQPLSASRSSFYQQCWVTTVKRRGNVTQGENNEEAYDGKKQFKEWRRAVLLRLGEKGLEGALKPVNEHDRMVHEEHVTALQSRGKDVPKYMWLWEELYGDGEKEKENEEEESVREVTRKEREETETVRSRLTMKQSTVACLTIPQSKPPLFPCWSVLTSTHSPFPCVESPRCFSVHPRCPRSLPFPFSQLVPFPEPQIAQMAPRWRKYFVVHSGKQYASYASLFCATQGVALPIPRLPFWPEGSWIQLASFLVCASGCSTLKAHNP